MRTSFRLLAVPFILLSLGFGGAPANAASDLASPPGNWVELCDGNSLVTTDAEGQPLSSEVVAVAMAQVQHLCDVGVGSSITMEEYLASIDHPEQLRSYANVVAQINSRPGNMGISAYANSIPRDKKTKVLGCIYRMQPVTGPSKAWSSCGTAGPSTTSTYLTTRGNDFCPVKGTRWEAIADLSVNGSIVQSDSEVKVAL
ncbi:hypothetical protein ACEXQD_17370 [Herbiconiux sp. P15]|uniref:hypothetical protein n=1 Tax=Herbiconiux liukaitaii TaxID=3342799 RepID=UPI0035BA21EF